MRDSGLGIGRSSKEKVLSWNDFNEKTLAGCGMWCLEPTDLKGMLAVIKTYKAGKLQNGNGH